MQDNQVQEPEIPPKKAFLEAISPGGKFSLLMLFFFVGLILANIGGLMAVIPFLDFKKGIPDMASILKQLSNYSNTKIVTGLKIAQVISTIGTFIIPAIIFTLMVTRKKAEYLKINVLT